MTATRSRLINAYGLLSRGFRYAVRSLRTSERENLTRTLLRWVEVRIKLAGVHTGTRQWWVLDVAAYRIVSPVHDARGVHVVGLQDTFDRQNAPDEARAIFASLDANRNNITAENAAQTRSPTVLRAS